MLAYHYTTIIALERMLSRANRDFPYITLRATQCNYLHDVAENTLGRYILPQCIDRIEKELKVPAEKALTAIINDPHYMDFMLENIRTFNDHEFCLSTFILSFSECRDSLNLWTRYGDNGTGVALCFDMDMMHSDYSNYFNETTKACRYWAKDALKSGNAEIDTTLYEEVKSMYKAVTDHRVTDTFGKMYEQEGSGDIKMRIVNTIVGHLMSDFSIFNKTDDWQDEREIRLSLSAATPDIIYYKRNAQDLDYVPAVDVSFPLRAMKSIVIGPKCGRNTYGMIQSLFYQRGLYNRDLQVMESSCPLR